MELIISEKKLTRVDKLIRSAFAELLQKKEFSKIKVSEIIALADVSRSAFYAHYVDIYDLLDTIENELFSGLVSLMQQVQASGTEYRKCSDESKITGKYESSYFIFLRSQQLWWSLFMAGKGRTDFVQRLTHVVYRQLFESKQRWNDPADPSFPQMTSFVMAAWTYVGLFSYWLETGMKETPLEMGRQLAVFWYRFRFRCAEL